MAVSILNNDNFFQWLGEFEEAPFENIAVDDVAQVAENADSVDLSPLLNDTSTYGINPLSFQITLQDNPFQPATFNASTGVLTYYPPVGVVIGETRTIKYTWTDINGAISNEATVSITIIARAKAWRGYGPSYQCNAPGEAQYLQLEEYYTDDNESVVPAHHKPNVNTDPDYIAPAVDFAACPNPDLDPGTLYIYNNSATVAILQILFKRVGQPDVAYVLNQSAGDTIRTIQVGDLAAPYDEVQIQLGLPAGGAVSATGSLSIEPAAGGSAADSTALVTLQTTYSLYNVSFPTGTSYIGKIELND
jgi:hypothetical protein